MRHWIANVLALLSALLAAVAVAVWISSAVVSVTVYYTVIDRSAEPVWQATELGLATVPHELSLGLRRIRHDRRRAFVPLQSIAPPGFTWCRQTPRPADVARLRQLGFHFHGSAFANTGYGDGWDRAVDVPFWFLVAAATVLPAWRAWRWATRRRRPPTACRRCGYDLRASPARCPECGVTPAAASGPR